jgi:type I restriction enzyme S subunit
MIEWRECTLGDIITFQRGHDLPKKNMTGEEYPVAGSNGIIGLHNKYTTEAPAITIGRSGNVGNPYIYYENIWAHNTTLYIKEYKNSDPEFTYYLLKTMNLGDYASGSAVPTLNRNHIHTLPVKIPRDIVVQKKIASILKLFDVKIDNNEAINRNLLAQANAMHKEMVLDLADNEVSEGILSDIATIVMGQSPKGDTYNEEGKGEVFYQGRAEFGERFPTRRLFTTDPKRMAEVNSVLMSVRAPVGDINVAYERCCIGRGLCSVYSNDNHQSFVLYTMYSLKKDFDIYNGEGTVFGSINRDAMNNMKIRIPQQTVVDRFEELVSPIDLMIKKNYEENCRLIMLRDSLLPKLMSGDLDLSDLDI